MTIIAVHAHIQCDGCGQRFRVNLDAADVGCVSELVDQGLGEVGCGGRTSLQGEHQLCPRCTKAVDDALPEDATPTREEVAAILDAKVHAFDRAQVREPKGER